MDSGSGFQPGFNPAVALRRCYVTCNWADVLIGSMKAVMVMEPRSTGRDEGLFRWILYMKRLAETLV